MATFITSKEVGEFIDINVQTSTGYWKYNHNGTDSSVFNQGDGNQSIEVLNANGEFTLISCLSDGTVSGDITYLYLFNGQLTSFNGTGLSGLTELNLDDNQITGFTGTGLSGLTQLYLNNNQLTSFNGTGLSGLTELYLDSNQLTSFNGTGLSGLTQLYLNNNQLTSFNGTGLSGLTNLGLSNNQLTGLDVSPMTSLINLFLTSKDGGNPLTASANDSILDQLEVNGLSNGTFSTIGGRTAAGTADYDTLISRNWTIDGADLVSAVRKLRVKGVGQLNP